MLLVTLNLVAVFCKYYTSHPNAWGIIPQFELDGEKNIPTYFSSFILILSSILLFTISLVKKHERNKYTKHWRLLAFVFLYMSVDESAGLHEMFIYPLRDHFQLAGIFYFSWVIVGAAVVLILGLYYLRFLLELNPKLRLRMISAGMVYVGGALGVELLGGYYYDANGGHNLTYSLITTVEETLEITGVLILIHSLYSYLKRHLLKFTLQLGDEPQPGILKGDSNLLKQNSDYAEANKDLMAV
ncbi:hypothetical protein [Pontibacter oryzae]|uniref:hypothetical protein n=1 Tax=Pontibacter oryzae TaxID=2304593 RepID=UPI0011C36F4B|nr:hypothetical protein [Pontibacter oryzae]